MRTDPEKQFPSNTVIGPATFTTKSPLVKVNY